MIKRVILAILSALAFPVVVALSMASPADASFDRGLPYAVHEDACAAGVPRCVWDGHHQGNNGGRSYIIRGEHVRFISHQRAHRLQTAYCNRPQVACGY